jgi:uncharacterized phage-associated protein
MKPVQTNDLSDFILFYCIKNEIPINHLKLQKILYYTQAWHLVYFDKFPIFQETPQAWVNGPVYRSVYEQFKGKGKYDNFELQEQYRDKIDEFFSRAKEKLLLEPEQWKFIDAILTNYALMSHEKLVMLTHSERPWNEAREGLGLFDYSENQISLESMYNYYSKLHESNKQQ